MTVSLTTEHQKVLVEAEKSLEQFPPLSGAPLNLDEHLEAVLFSMKRLSKFAASGVSASSGVKVDCAVTLTAPRCRPITVGNTPKAETLASSENDYQEGPLSQSMSSGASIIIHGSGGLAKWQTYRHHLIDAGYESVLSVPVPVGDGMMCALAFFGPIGISFSSEVVGVVNCFASSAAENLLSN